ncbi:MAG: 2-phospho-L-lactate guanylyltransferase [Deltaproteobacteria bacterium]|nr:2-phospho-L-lactate guanylyltransferase [Deltaproteobacteria bacterium]
MNEIVFQVTQEADGGYTAECLTENIFTEGDTWAELQKNVMDAVAGFFFDREKPRHVRLHLVKDELLAVG